MACHEDSQQTYTVPSDTAVLALSNIVEALSVPSCVYQLIRGQAVRVHVELLDEGG